jgi:hypothetical protein
MTRSKSLRLTGPSERTLTSVENGKQIDEAGLRRLHEMNRLREQLARVMKPEFIPQWLETPHAPRLRFEDKEQSVEINPGDFISIPAHKRHRVEWTQS